ncbi:hypothetical protein N7455_000703 [Penicillium solitum]|uniref:uncharacterized protein n=1 Tax=Penicillium solitum TaxID=60172 RepID=UPI00181A09B6|nr:hypothetical protein HAV15_007389 [Penicillium sp. str. \
MEVGARSGCSKWMLGVVVTSLPIVLKPEPATFRLVDVDYRYGRSKWMVEVVVTSLPIVLKPKPATVRLVVIELDRWLIEVDGEVSKVRLLG